MKMNIAAAAFALKFQISRVIEVLHFTSIIHDATLKLQTFYRFFRTYLQLQFLSSYCILSWILVNQCMPVQIGKKSASKFELCAHKKN